jgi:hypothetical protein
MVQQQKEKIDSKNNMELCQNLNQISGHRTQEMLAVF